MAIKHSQELVNRCCELRLAGSPIRIIAHETGIPASTVHQIVTGQIRTPDRLQHTERKERRTWLASEVEYVRQQAGRVPVSQIAAHLQRTPHALRSLAYKEKISLALNNIDSHDEWLCCELYKEGLTMKLIAEKMEMTPYMVCKLIKSWGLR